MYYCALVIRYNTIVTLYTETSTADALHDLKLSSGLFFRNGILLGKFSVWRSLFNNNGRKESPVSVLSEVNL